MQRDTFQSILNLSEERFQLYLLAGHQRLLPDQASRLDEITARLPVLWDQYRRELAAGSRESMERVAAQTRSLRPDIDWSAPDEQERRAA